MTASGKLQLRAAGAADTTVLSELLRDASWIHQHFDWISAYDLLGEEPFLFALDGGRVVGCLACPIDPPGVAWVRVFAVAEKWSPAEIWRLLWPEAQTLAREGGARFSAALLSATWLGSELKATGFAHTKDVVFLERRVSTDLHVTATGPPPRTLETLDLEAIVGVDKLAFGTLWHYSLPTLQAAIQQAAYATVVENHGVQIGYQISTSQGRTAHLARLAVHPAWQGQGVGRTLVLDTLAWFAQRGVTSVTVNTQSDNHRSLRLYRSLGFQALPGWHPVYEAVLPPP